MRKEVPAPQGLLPTLEIWFKFDAAPGLTTGSGATHRKKGFAETMSILKHHTSQTEGIGPCFVPPRILSRKTDL
jgi:hypothetical protein